jgi:hypothetical protein
MNRHLPLTATFHAAVLIFSNLAVFGQESLSINEPLDERSIEFETYFSARITVVPARFVVVSLFPENFQTGSATLDELSIPELRSHLDLSSTQKQAIDKLIKKDQSDRLAKIVNQLNQSHAKISDISELTMSMEEHIDEQVQKILLRPQTKVLEQLRRRRSLLLLGWEEAIKQALHTPATTMTPQQQQQLKKILDERRRDIIEKKNTTITELNQKAFELLAPKKQNELQVAVFQWDAQYPYPFEFFVEALAASDLKDRRGDSLMKRLNVQWQYNRMGQVKQMESPGFLAASFIHSLNQIGQIDAMETQMEQFWATYREPNSKLSLLRKHFQEQSSINVRRFAEGSISYPELSDMAMSMGVEYEESVFDEFFNVLLPFQKPLVEKVVNQCDVFNRSLIGSLTGGELARVLELDRTTREQIHKLQKESVPQLRNLLKELDLETRSQLFNVLRPEQRQQLEETYRISDIDADVIHHPELMLLPRELDLVRKKQ